MLEPSLAFQTGVRAALLADAAVAAMVPADRVRAGSTRPDASPCIVLGDAQTAFLGRTAGGQFLARVFLTLHAWALEDGQDTGRALVGAVVRILSTAPSGLGPAARPSGLPSPPRATASPPP